MTNNTPTFSFTTTKTLLIAALTATLTLITTITLTINPNAPQPGPAGSTAYPPTLDALSTGCGDYYHWKPQPGTHFAYISDENLTKIEQINHPPMIVPAWGYLTEKGLPADQIRYYQPDEQTPNRLQILRTMYDYDTLVIYYTPNMDYGDRELLRNYTNTHPNTLTLPWNTKQAGELPNNRQTALAKWGTTQTCELWNETATQSFINFTQNNPQNRTHTVPEIEPRDNGTLPIPWLQEILPPNKNKNQQQEDN